MGKSIADLNSQGIVAYQIKCIIALIEYFGYDYEEWRELLEKLSDYTCLAVAEKESGYIHIPTNREWNYELDKFAPENYLQPFLTPVKKSRKIFLACDSCRMKKYQFDEYGAAYGLCVNSHSCENVRRRYDLPRAYINPRREEFTRKVYDWYMRTDFSVLTVLNNIINIDSDMSSDFFRGRKTVYLYDTLKTLDKLYIMRPDTADISEYAFGETRENFSCADLLKKHTGQKAE